MSIFNRSQKRRIEQSVQNLSHSFKGTFYPGLIYPILCTKVVPGDTFQIASNPFLRSMPFTAPLMTNVYCDIRYFYCRNLLLWENFDKYITNAQKYGVGYLDPAYRPVHPAFNFDTGDLSNSNVDFFDYLYGVIDDRDAEVRGLDSLPARMYNLVYNEYYNNENYGKTATVFHEDYSDQEAGDVTSGTNHYVLRHGCYKQDYFTSMLPSPQRGNGVSLPSDVVLKGLGLHSKQLLVDSGGNPLTPGSHDAFNLIGYELTDETELRGYDAQSAAEAEIGFLDPNGTFGVSIDLNDLRKASAVQRFLERSAVNGNRYAEYMLAHFGVRTPDNSSFRPQYLGGGSSVINYSPVEQNGATGSGSTPQGTLAGKGTLSGVVGMNHRYFFTEYGWIMALMVIRPEAEYFGGVNRQYWVMGDRLDNYYNPAFQNIGMQGVKRKELSVGLQSGGSANEVFNDDDIGYQERYMEYKNIPNSVHGELRRTSMHDWVAVRDFSYGTVGGEFGIDENFMEVQGSVFANNVAVDKFPPFVMAIRHNVIARRPMQYHAKYGGLL